MDIPPNKSGQAYGHYKQKNNHMKQKRIPKTVQNQNARKIISKQILKQQQNREKTNKKKQYFIILSCLSIFLITLFTLWGVNNNTS
jgi:hypothetical protein